MTRSRPAALPKASILVVTYNGLNEATIPCLDSVFERTTHPDFEVVVVDNASTDGTPEHLSALVLREPRLKVVLNRKNRGFAGGNNDALREASGEILVLLNNDTQVSEGWLERLCGPLLRDRSVGLLGPVSNSVGNEQMICTRGGDPAAILAEGRVWTEAARGDTFETERLGFFCVATRRDVVDKVGPLDEGYGLGFFEDDDYCIRVRNAGYRLLCAEDVFVYHRGSVSFGKMPEKVRALLKANRRRLEKKFGVRHEPTHPRERQLDLAEACLAGGVDPRKARVKASNRLAAAEGQAPRGMLKRWRFEARVKRIREKLEMLV